MLVVLCVRNKVVFLGRQKRQVLIVLVLGELKRHGLRPLFQRRQGRRRRRRRRWQSLLEWLWLHLQLVEVLLALFRLLVSVGDILQLQLSLGVHFLKTGGHGKGKVKTVAAEAKFN